MNTVINVIKDACGRITSYGRMFFDGEKDPRDVTIEEKELWENSISQVLGNSNISNIKNLNDLYPEIANLPKDNKILVVDYENLQSLQHTQNFLADGIKIPFKLPMCFLFNYIIRLAEPTCHLIIFFKKDKYVTSDIQKLLENEYLNYDFKSGGLSYKIRYFMIETMVEIKRRIHDGSLKIQLVFVNSLPKAITNDRPCPHQLKSFDDCTILHYMNLLKNNYFTNYKLISNDMRLVDDFQSERLLLLPYTLEKSELVINNGIIEVRNLESVIINPIRDPFFTNSLPFGYDKIYGIKGLINRNRISGYELNDLIRDNFFTPGMNMNHRIKKLRPAVANENDLAKKYIPQIFMNVTEDNLLSNNEIKGYYHLWNGHDSDLAAVSDTALRAKGTIINVNPFRDTNDNIIDISVNIKPILKIIGGVSVYF